jgi:crotonobetainyl-CoA:carnitine CoA-transferase CaiB-like acyl-CoA transferase
MTISKDDYKGVASPIKFSRSKTVDVKYKPPKIGQHTKEILLENGYSQETIEEMLAGKIVFD